jgi:hypothetical protein
MVKTPPCAGAAMAYGDAAYAEPYHGRSCRRSRAGEGALGFLLGFASVVVVSRLRRRWSCGWGGGYGGGCGGGYGGGYGGGCA